MRCYSIYIILVAEGVYFSMSTKSSASFHRKTATSWNSCDVPHNGLDKTDTERESWTRKYSILAQNYIYL